MRLLEKKYEDIFSPETLAVLKGKSKENYINALQGRSKQELFRDLPRLSREVANLEKGYEDELEQIATLIVKDAYPIIEEEDIEIDAKIVPQSQVGDARRMRSYEEDPTEPEFGDDDFEETKAKIRLIQAIEQGAALKGTFSFLMFREYIDQIDPELVDKYVSLQKTSDAMLDDESQVAFMMNQLAQGRHMGQAGESHIYWDDMNDRFVIRARAINFPILVHEIVKGLYMIIGTGGTPSDDEEKMKAAMKAVDRPEHEPEDFMYGKVIYNAINQVFADSDVKDTSVRERFLDKLIKLDYKQLKSFIENAVKDSLTPEQKRWVDSTIKSLEGR